MLPMSAGILFFSFTEGLCGYGLIVHTPSLQLCASKCLRQPTSHIYPEYYI